MSVVDEIERQAELIFHQCDRDNKGYLTKNDLRVLMDYIPMDETQLTQVFNSLDRDKDSRLTLNEFLSGFGQYLQGSNSRDSFYGPPEGSDDSFDETIEGTGMKECLEDIELVEEVWKQVRQENPALLPDFEKLLTRISEKLRKSKSEYQSIENEMRVRKNAHEDEVRHLYDEVENQIKRESQKLMELERIKERNRRLEMENEIQDKDRMYQEMQNHYEQMLKRMRELESMQTETVTEKHNLARERDLLHSRLTESETNLQECQEYIEILKAKAKEDRKMRARAVIDLNEGIALERETLVRQMEQLRELNRQLRDERDERMSFQHRYGELLEGGENLGSLQSRPSLTVTECSGLPQGTVLGPDEARARHNVEQYPNYLNGSRISAETISRRGSTLAAYFGNGNGRSRKPTDDFDCDQPIISEDFDGASVFSGQDSSRVSPKFSPINERKAASASASGSNSVAKSISTVKEENEISNRSSLEGSTYLSSRILSSSRNNANNRLKKESLQSVFKVIFIGDSSVGKTTIIKHYALGEYHPHTATTVGVDYQIKTLKVDDSKAVLQLWDTAGQEKFRSITKQYFRKADGIVVVFDMTNIESFIHVRSWMECLQDSAPENRTIMLLGNKNDLINPAEMREGTYVTPEMGRKMASQYDALFYPVSGKTAENLEISFLELSRKMKLNEDKERIEATQNLTAGGPLKTSCCGGFKRNF